MNKPKIIKINAFGGDWFMFYCGKCGATIDMNYDIERRQNCIRCKNKINWSKQNEKTI